MIKILNKHLQVTAYAVPPARNYSSSGSVEIKKIDDKLFFKEGKQWNLINLKLMFILIQRRLILCRDTIVDGKISWKFYDVDTGKISIILSDLGKIEFCWKSNTYDFQITWEAKNRCGHNDVLAWAKLCESINMHQINKIIELQKQPRNSEQKESYKPVEKVLSPQQQLKKQLENIGWEFECESKTVMNKNEAKDYIKRRESELGFSVDILLDIGKNPHNYMSNKAIKSSYEKEYPFGLLRRLKRPEQFLCFYYHYLYILEDSVEKIEIAPLDQYYKKRFETSFLGLFPEFKGQIIPMALRL